MSGIRDPKHPAIVIEVDWFIADRERRERDRDREAPTESERVELRRLRRENA